MARPVVETTTEPPRADVWGGRGIYYRVELKDYRAFPKPLPLTTLIRDYGGEIRKEIVESRPRHYPLATYGPTLRVVQGMYLARCTPYLLDILADALGIELASFGSSAELEHREYAEGLRRSREAFFFSRNPTLAKDAKAHHGYSCQACGFNFQDRYGDLGEGYIECHHTNPLSERSESEWTEEVRTTLDEVVVLCANCHRMIHRRRPALTLDELKTRLGSNLTQGGF